MPRMRVMREPDFPGTLSEAPLEFAWPYASVAEHTVDLRCVSDPREKSLYFFYGTEMEAGWCAVTDTAKRLACGFRFDPAVFPSCWLFASYGGWRDYNVAVLEPCTGYPLQFAAMQAAGRRANYIRKRRWRLKCCLPCRRDWTRYAASIKMAT
jgi:hypothetical protein